MAKKRGGQWTTQFIPEPETMSNLLTYSTLQDREPLQVLSSRNLFIAIISDCLCLQLFPFLNGRSYRGYSFVIPRLHIVEGEGAKNLLDHSVISKKGISRPEEEAWTAWILKV